jgi:hypothetical protein
MSRVERLAAELDLADDEVEASTSGSTTRGSSCATTAGGRGRLSSTPTANWRS